MISTIRRKGSVFVLQNRLQSFGIPFDASDPEERRLVAQAYGVGDWAHHFFEAERFESCEEEFDYIVELGCWDDDGCVVNRERHDQ